MHQPPSSAESPVALHADKGSGFLDRSTEWRIMLELALLAGMLGACAIFLNPPRGPAITDEFSVLLGAETFAQGRLTNPTHPHWEFFESLHIIHEPSYQSKYQPARAAFAALGIVLFKTPFAGQVILQMLFTAAIYWGLRAVFSRTLCVIATLVALVFFGIYSYMAMTFFGGLVAGLGGTLVLGSALYLWRQSENPPQNLPGLGVLMALGATLLMFSRPYEGLVACLVPGTMVLWKMFGKHEGRTVRVWAAFLLPFAAVMIFAFLLQGIYNRAVTGDWLTLPYQIYSEKYDLNESLFIRSGQREDVSFENEFMQRAYEFYLTPRLAAEYNPLSQVPKRIIQTGQLWLGPFLPILLLAGLAAWTLPVRWALLHIVVGFGALLISFAFHPHYYAPFYFALLVVVVAGVHWVLTVKMPRVPPAGRVIGLLALLLCAIFWQVQWQMRELPEEGEKNYPMLRKEMTQEFARTPQPDLVFVQQVSLHNIWNYNGPNIDAQPVVWAADRGLESNQILLNYYPNHRPWLLLASNSLALVPYPTSEEQYRQLLYHFARQHRPVQVDD